MSRPERQQNVLDLLKRLRGIEPLKQLFWSELNYQRVNEPLSRRGWTESASKVLADDPVLFAGGGEGNAFHVIYCRLASEKLLLVSERPVVSRLLSEHPYTLFIFSNAAQDRWHFVNVRYDDAAEKRRLYRRVTIGPDERLRTPSECIAMLDLQAITPELFAISPLTIQQRHDDAFDKEHVTDAFFEDFRETFAAIASEIESQNASLDSAKAETVAQELLDRLLFLYFIQRKGWLDGDRDYLANRFSPFRSDSKGTKFYSTFLLRLFQKLSISPEKGLEWKELGVLPFLNGGLFDFDPCIPDPDASLWIRLKVRNQVFEKLFDKRTGLFEKYNFTVREDTPLDTTVAVDPEMLGRIFESLVLKMEKGEDLRKKTGSFYTPRICVHSMCQEALLHYVLSKVRSENKLERKAAAWQQKLESLLQLNAIDGVDPDEEELLRKAISPDDAKWLREAVLCCRACDLAVGSGAFPIAMLHEMINLVRLADACVYGPSALQRRNYDYDLKRRIIEDCLYGVDIQEKAVRICEVRLWLSLVVDYELGVDLRNCNKEEMSTAIKSIPTLPNLTHHIRCGDSLIEKIFGHPVQLKELARHDDGLIAKVSAPKREYYHERDLDKKRRLELGILSGYCDLAGRLIKRKKEGFKGIQRGMFGENKQEREEREERERELQEFERVEKRANTVKQRIAAALERKRLSEREYESIRSEFQGNIVWALDFAEIFSAHGGFSIVIANPPYISFGLRGNKAAKAEWGDYMRRYYPRSAEYKLSVYALFIDRGIQLVSPNGVLTYITPDSFLLGRYFSKLRRLILDSCAVRNVAMFEQDFWKSGVVGRPTITTLTRPAAKSPVRASLFSTIDAFQRGVGRHYEYSSEYFETVPYNRFRLFFCRTAKEYARAVEAGSSPLKSFARITTGVRSKSGQENVVATTQKGPKWKKGIVSGSQVLPYHVEWNGHYLNIDGDLLFSGGWDSSIVEHPKIMIRQTGDSIIAALDFDHLYHLNNVHSLAPLRNDVSLPYICAVLNSRLMNRYYHLVSLEYGRAMAQTDIETLDLLPIQEPSLETIERIEDLVRKIDSPEAKVEIEHIVEELYGLWPELTEYLRGDDHYPDLPELAAGRIDGTGYCYTCKTRQYGSRVHHCASRKLASRLCRRTPREGLGL